MNVTITKSISSFFTKLCVDIKDIRQYFHSVAWVMSQEWDLGVLGVKNIVMWHIKLKRDDQ